jgi:hypothetical protein
MGCRIKRQQNRVYQISGWFVFLNPYSFLLLIEDEYSLHPLYSFEWEGTLLIPVFALQTIGNRNLVLMLKDSRIW